MQPLRAATVCELDRVWEGRVTRMVRNSDAVKVDGVGTTGVASCFRSVFPFSTVVKPGLKATASGGCGLDNGLEGKETLSREMNGDLSTKDNQTLDDKLPM